MIQESQNGLMLLRVVNNFLHDLATGTWGACLLVILILSRRIEPMPLLAREALGDAMLACFTLLAIALALIAGTGGIRMFYWRREASPEELAIKRRALIAKHVFFVVVCGPGTAWAWWMLP